MFRSIEAFMLAVGAITVFASCAMIADMDGKRPKRLALAVVVGALLLAISSCSLQSQEKEQIRSAAYSGGHDSGYESGYEEGYQRGYDDGWSEGYEEAEKGD